MLRKPIVSFVQQPHQIQLTWLLQRKLLERKTEEELQREIDREQKRDFVNEEGEFINDDAKVKFFLKKGKLEDNQGDENVLTVD